MTDAKIDGMAVTLKLDQYVLRTFGDSVGAETPAQAMAKIQSVWGESETSFAAYDVVASLFYHMALRGAEKTGAEIALTLKDCYDVLTDAEAMKSMLQEISDFFPKADEVKKKEMSEAE